MQSLISPDAQIHPSVEIGPYCHIGPQVKIAEGCRLLSHVVIQGKVSIGKDNSFYPFVTIGLDPQDISHKQEETEVVIGEKNIFREGFTLHKGTLKQEGKTIVGNENFFMAHSHIAHDVVVGNNNTVINNCLIAGHVVIGDGVFMGGATCVQQFIQLGNGSYIGGMSAVEKDIPPYMTAYGNRVELRGLNLIGLKRKGFDKKAISEALALISKIEKKEINLKTYFEEEPLKTENVILKEIETFVLSSKRGIAPFRRK